MHKKSEEKINVTSFNLENQKNPEISDARKYSSDSFTNFRGKGNQVNIFDDPNNNNNCIAFG